MKGETWNLYRIFMGKFPENYLLGRSRKLADNIMIDLHL
jgi:hypothetical protein